MEQHADNTTANEYTKATCQKVSPFKFDCSMFFLHVPLLHGHGSSLEFFSLLKISCNSPEANRIMETMFYQE